MISKRRVDALKRALDVALIVATAPISIPILALCAIAIRIDSRGPVIFRQARTGRHGSSFQMFKFRTMVVDADKLKEELQHLNVLPAPDFKIPNDPRITRVGRHLRSSSLDELPQLWNVLKGDMSIVGPRPTSFSPGHRHYKLWHTRRLEVRPGLTGLWQLEGRNTTDFDQRIRLDEQYIQHRSIGLDLAIMARTIPALMRREGA